jgi:flagellin
LNNPGPTFSINGITIDISNASNGNATGSQSQGEIEFHPGNNSPIPAVDNSLILQVGPDAAQTLKIDIDDCRLSALELSSLSVVPRSKAVEALSLVDAALDKILQGRSKLGANQNRLEHIINNLSVYEENLTSSESRIRDADMAKEMVENTKSMIIAQAGQAMLAQANSTSQQILSLLQT